MIAEIDRRSQDDAARDVPEALGDGTLGLRDVDRIPPIVVFEALEDPLHSAVRPALPCLPAPAGLAARIPGPPLHLLRSA